MHPAISKFIKEFEENARRNRSYRTKIGTAEMMFLENVWGPVFQFNFDGLRAEYPFSDSKGGDRFVDFIYRHANIKLVIEIDGYTTHARNISSVEFDDHLDRQNDLLLTGWFLLRFSARQVEHKQSECQAKLQRAIGHLWSLTNGASDMHAWEIRKQSLIQLAFRTGGHLRPVDVARQFHLHSRTAQHWLKRFAAEGFFEAAGGSVRTTVYRLADHLNREGGNL